MTNENGEWIMYGTDYNDPYCLKSCDDAIKYIDEVGFLPLFKNAVPGFSIEERTVPYFWWSGDIEHDPWEWRVQIARSGKVAYGKFFDRKAGFISLKWLPYFINWRRDGYDFDTRCEEGLAPIRQVKIMNRFDIQDEYFSFQLKRDAGFGKGGEKNFDGIVTDLEMMTYLVLRDFRCRKNKYGEEYGWAIAVLSTPEHIWGYDLCSSAYSEDPEESKLKIYNHLRDIYPIASEAQIKSILK